MVPVTASISCDFAPAQIVTRAWGGGELFNELVELLVLDPAFELGVVEEEEDDDASG